MFVWLINILIPVTSRYILHVCVHTVIPQINTPSEYLLNIKIITFIEKEKTNPFYRKILNTFFISKLIIYNATFIPNVSKEIRKHEDIWKTICQNFIHQRQTL